MEGGGILAQKKPGFRPLDVIVHYESHGSHRIVDVAGFLFGGRKWGLRFAIEGRGARDRALAGGGSLRGGLGTRCSGRSAEPRTKGRHCACDGVSSGQARDGQGGWRGGAAESEMAALRVISRGGRGSEDLSAGSNKDRKRRA